MTESYGRRTELPMFEDVLEGFFSMRFSGRVTRVVVHSLTVAARKGDRFYTKQKS